LHWVTVLSCANTLIKRTDGEWFDLHGRPAEAFRSSSFPSERVPGWGDWRIRTLGVEISFSYEDLGIQVVFEDELPQPVADQIIDEILRNIELVSGQKGRILRI